MPHLWLEYRLELLKFCNGAKLQVPGNGRARLLFNDSERIVAIDQLDMPAAAIDRAIRPVMDVQICQIDYRISTEGFSAVHYYHPEMNGHHVYLLPRMASDRTLRVRQQNGRAFFSRDYTLREVTSGKVPSDQRVWQFNDEV